jgi:hypothetical protein
VKLFSLAKSRSGAGKALLALVKSYEILFSTAELEEYNSGTREIQKTKDQVTFLITHASLLCSLVCNYYTDKMSTEDATVHGATPGDRVAIGISFGNSNSSIAVTSVDDKAEVIANEDGGMFLFLDNVCTLKKTDAIRRSSNPFYNILCRRGGVQWSASKATAYPE